MKSDLGEVIDEVCLRRMDQDGQWGGPDHDDAHRAPDWLIFIRKFEDRAWASARKIEHEASRLLFEKAMIDIAALAIAAVQSSRRKMGL